MRKDLTLSSLRAMLLSGDITPREAVMLCRDSNETMFAHSLHDRALERARYAADRIAERSTRDTTGIPIAIEDTLCVAGLPGHKDDRSYSATVVQKLDGYGALIVGLLHGAAYGITANGSHGAHYAVRMRLCFAALGSGVFPLSGYTHGLEEVTALRPSFGTVSRYGLVVAAPSLKQVGIVAPNAMDVATVMDAISDFDPYDPAMLRPNCYDYAQEIGKPVQGVTIGVCRGANLAKLDALGCKSARVAMPARIRETYTAIEAAEAVFTLAKAPALRGLDATLELGGRVLADGLYPKAMSARGQITSELKAALEGCDAILVPPGEQSAMAAELSGLPCIARGETMLLGRMCDEVTLLKLMSALEGGEAAC